MTAEPVASVAEQGGAVVVQPHGDIDLSRSPGLRNVLRRVQQGAPDLLVIDLADVSYMDSSGLATLVESMRAAKNSNGRLVLAGMTQRVRSIFEIARLDQFFIIEDSVDAAVGG